jgi:nicotinamidase-related amidase
VTLISDGCATVTPELQKATITTMKDRYARVLSTEEAIAELLEIEDSERAGDD